MSNAAQRAIVLPLVLACGGAVAPGAAWARPAGGAPEPAHVAIASFGGVVLPDRVWVKFRDGLAITSDGEGGLTHDGALAGVMLPDGSFERAHWVSDDELRRIRTIAEGGALAQGLPADLPDMELEFVLKLPAGAGLEATIDALRALDVVDYALPMPAPVEPPLPPNYRPQQGYLDAPASGVGTAPLWGWPGGRGNRAAVANIEYDVNLLHQDLPVITRLGPPSAGTPWADHGTAVFGQMASRDNGWGTTGAIPDSPMFISHPSTSSGYNVASALTAATAGLTSGDVILIEQQMTGPTGAFVPVEWFLPTYNAVRQAVLANISVVQAAGNGNANLDASAFSTGNGGHYPFLAQNDSGSIIVGAGAAPSSFGGTGVARSRLSFSTFGSTVDLQGWGERIVTTGYGGLYSAQGTNLWYTGTFGGTSGASPIVTSAVVSLRSIVEAVDGRVLTPAQVRSLLRSTGLAQQGTVTGNNIGPMPDVRAAVALALGSWDCNTNSIPDRVETAMNPALDASGDGLIDACQCDSIDFNRDAVFPDDADLTAFLQVLGGGNCPTCGDADFNNDGVFPDDADLASFLRVLGGGVCL